MNDDTPPKMYPLLQQRRSIYSYDPNRSVGPSVLDAMFEAARNTMSCFNAQPWRYIVGTRDKSPETRDRILQVLVPANQTWAQYAPVLALGISVLDFEYNSKPNAHANHDLGAASALLTVEASAHGVMVHQMAGFNTDEAVRVFKLEPSLQVMTALAIGYPGKNPELPEDLAARDQKPRQRKAVSELILAGGW